MNTASLSALGAKAKPLAEGIARWCEQEGIGVEFGRRGKHPFAELTFNRQTRKFFFSGTPSDWRTSENQIRDIKATVRAMGWTPRKETEMETPVVKSLADLPKLAEPAQPGVPQIPEKWRGKSIRGNIRCDELRAALDARNTWVSQEMKAGKTSEYLLAKLQKAGWDVQTPSAIDMMAFKADGSRYPSEINRVKPLPKAANPPTIPARPERVEIEHRAPEGLDPLVIAIAQAIAPLFHEQLRTLRAKADKWDAISGLVREA
jgi:hypothetical protein